MECKKGWIPPGVLVTNGEKCPELRCPYNMYGIAGKKVLSIIMPWPWLIFNYGKDVENRTWYTDYRGELLIHASKKPAPNYRDIIEYYITCPHLLNKNWDEIKKTWCGCIVGSVELIDCVHNSKSEWADQSPWHWVLSKPKLFKKPIPAKGSLGIWEYKEYGDKAW
jgi:hypothetical protein